MNQNCRPLINKERQFLFRSPDVFFYSDFFLIPVTAFRLTPRKNTVTVLFSHTSAVCRSPTVTTNRLFCLKQ